MKKTNTKENNEIIEIPAEEAPYALPDGWKWVRLGDLYEVNPKNVAESCIEAAFIPMEKIKPGMVSEFSYEVKPWGIAKKGHTQFADGDVAFAKITPCFENRKSMMLYNLPNGIGAGTTELIVLRQPNVLQKYTFWLINSENFIRSGKNTYSGTVGQQRISMDFVRNYPIPLPPLETQQRIVDRIESLFAKLDEAKEKAQTALDTFELRKSAILHKAFTGELTAQWREEHGIGLDSWEETKLEKGIKLLSGQDFKPSQYNDTNDGLPYITGASNFDEDHVIINRWTPSPSVIAQKDDVLVVCKGSGYGKTIIADFDKAHIARQIMAIRVNGRVLNRFVFYYLQSEYEYLRNSGQGLIPGIARNIILSMPISIPPIEEQDEIVKIIERVFSREQQAKEAAEAVIEKIDLMKKSILARAFRGEL